MGYRSFLCLRCPLCSSPSLTILCSLPSLTKAVPLLKTSLSIQSKIQVFKCRLPVYNELNLPRHRNLSYHHCCHELCHHGDTSSLLDNKHVDSFPAFQSKHFVSTSERLLRSLCEAGQLSQAINLLSRIKSPIHNSNYVSLLKACIACAAPASARQVYTHLIQYSSGVTPMLADYLAITFAKCGAIDDAIYAFNSLSHSTVLSWTAMISAFIDNGCSEDALQMFHLMQEDGVEPDTYTFVALFKACGMMKNIKEGLKLHCIAHEKGFTSNLFVGNTLLSMYAKCGDESKADEVFGALPRRSIVSWNGMLSALKEDGLTEDVLLSYRQICEELKDPDPISLVSALQACGSLAEIPDEDGEVDKHMYLQIGRGLHSFARMRSYESDLFVGTALINMYGKCGAINDAQHVFEALPQHDVVSWNTMLSVFVQQNQREKALQLYTWMAKEGLGPDESTFVLLFEACESFAEEDAFSIEFALDIGQALHLDVCKHGLENTLAVGNSLVMMYGRHGAVMEAEHVFGNSGERNVVSWSNMLSVYADQGRGENGLLLFRQMQAEGPVPDQHVLALALQACAVLSQEDWTLIGREHPRKRLSYEMGQSVLVDACRSGFCLDSYVVNVLINTYSKCVGVEEAEDVFLSLSDRDIVTWTTMLSAYVEHGQASKALQLYILMHEECVAPNELTLVMALHACSILGDCERASSRKESSWKFSTLEIVQALHSDADRLGLISNTSARIALLTAYGKCGDIVEAENLLNPLPLQDLAGWKAIFSVYLEHGLGEKALCLYKEMQKWHALVDEVSLICLLHACRGSANLETCRELHFYVIAGGHGKSISLATSLILAYVSCASIEDMQGTFNEVVRPDAVCWTACMNGNAGIGNFIASGEILERSRLAGLKPDEVIVTELLLSSSNSGCIIEGLDYYTGLRENHGITLHLKHYGIIVGLLGRAGDLRRVENILSEMGMQTDGTIWSSLLCACNIHGNVELAKKAFTSALLKEQIEGPMYVLMSNLCCSNRQEEEAAELEHTTICLHEG